MTQQVDEYNRLELKRFAVEQGVLTRLNDEGPYGWGGRLFDFRCYGLGVLRVHNNRQRWRCAWYDVLDVSELDDVVGVAKVEYGRQKRHRAYMRQMKRRYGDS